MYIDLSVLVTLLSLWVPGEGRGWSRCPPMATAEASGPQGGSVGRCIPMGTAHRLGERPEWVGRSVHPDTGKAAGRRVCGLVGVCVHPEAQNSQSSEV